MTTDRDFRRNFGDPSRWGAWVENACLAFAWNSGQNVRYWREEPYEVDAILDGSWGRWAVEITTGITISRDVRSLAEFTRRYPSYRPLLLTEPSRLEEARRTGFEAMPWSQFLLDGPSPR